MLEITE